MKEALLIEKARERDPDAFAELMKQYMQSLYRTAKAILINDEDAADAIQETLLACWEKMGDLKEDRYFKTWLTRILINNCYAMIRKGRRIIYMDELPEIVHEDNAGNLEWEEALSAVDEKYRIVLVLYYAEGFGTKEIAKLLKIPDSTVRTRLSRGRNQLKKYYDIP